MIDAGQLISAESDLSRIPARLRQLQGRIETIHRRYSSLDPIIRNLDLAARVSSGLRASADSARDRSAGGFERAGQSDAPNVTDQDVADNAVPVERTPPAQPAPSGAAE